MTLLFVRRHDDTPTHVLQFEATPPRNVASDDRVLHTSPKNKTTNDTVVRARDSKQT